MKQGKKPNLSVTAVPRTDDPSASTNTRGFQVSDNGTLILKLQNGMPVEVRPRGANVNTQQADHSPGNLLGKIKWTDLKIGHVIGEGNQATVRKVKHCETGVIYALKSIDLSGHKIINKKTLQTELSRLAAANHLNVVSSCEAFFIDGKLKVLMEYMNLGTVSSLIRSLGPFPMSVLSHISKQILEGLGHLHSSGILHRDIKPSNLLLNTSGLLKISDFGVSTILTEHGQANTQIGSTSYMSPERVRGETHGASSDLWSVGLTCAECALGLFPLLTDDVDLSPNATENPFTQRVNMFDLSALIAEGRAVVSWDTLLPHIAKYYPQWNEVIIADSCRDLVAQCMRQNPNQRPPCSDLLQHPFLTEVFPGVGFQAWLKAKGVCPKKHKTQNAPPEESPKSVLSVPSQTTPWSPETRSPNDAPNDL
jgi:mitogen-activated protein kinase kinase 1